MNLSGKIAYVTGASRGIGRATAVALAKAGATVVMHARQVENLQAVRDELRAIGSESSGLAFGYEADDAQAVKEAFSTIQKTHGGLDILVNNAGILEDGMIGMITAEQMERMMRVNVQSVMQHLQYAARLMSRRQTGSIINLTSIMGLRGAEGLMVYSASKAAVVGATLAAAKELAPRNVRVNAVAPGFIQTDMASNLTPAKLQERLSAIRMNRAGEPGEVASAICFLASDLASYITGQVLGVDGGMVL